MLDAVLAKAKEGDPASASLVLSRILPSLLSQSQAVRFDFDPDAPITKQIEQVPGAAQAFVKAQAPVPVTVRVLCVTAAEAKAMVLCPLCRTPRRRKKRQRRERMRSAPCGMWFATAAKPSSAPTRWRCSNNSEN